jgi:uncharacterized protein YbcI
MEKLDPTMAQQIAKAASTLQLRHADHVPQVVTVVLSKEALVVTLHEALSPAEQALARHPRGAAQVQEFHRQVLATSSETLCQEIKRITGVAVQEAATEVVMFPDSAASYAAFRW